MKNIYIILILFLSFTIYSCAKKSDTSSTTTTNTELEGAWVSSCHSAWSSYWIKTWTFTGSALVVSGTNILIQVAPLIMLFGLILIVPSL